MVEWVGLTAVVVSVLFLALQVRQVNQIARSETSRELLLIFDNIHETAVTEPAVADLLVSLSDSSTELTPSQSVQVRHLSARFMNAYLAVHDAYVEGLITENIHDGFAMVLAGYLADYPGFALHLRARFERLPPETQARAIFAPLREQR